jgi:hypothetical protein
VLAQIGDKSSGVNEMPVLVRMCITGYFILDGSGRPVKTGGEFENVSHVLENLFDRIPTLADHLDNPGRPGAFYKTVKELNIPADGRGEHTVYIGPTPNSDEILGIVFDGVLPDGAGKLIQPEIFILSLITQAVRAFNRASNLEDILKIVLIGVTAGSGLGFNRAFILLTCDNGNCLKGTLANGPSSPEEAGITWEKLSSGELTLEMMFENVLKRNNTDCQPINELLKGLEIPLDKADNIFAQAALKKKSVIIYESELGSSEYSELNEKIGPGPLAVVPLVGEESLQGVLIADNFITHQEIAGNDLQLLEIFARYASDSIEKFRLNERLGKKVEALKRANETIILSRENLIKAERLSVLAEMAGQVAHEVRNPLTVIGGFTKSMLNKMDDENENHEYLKIIIEQVKRIEEALERFSSLVNYQEKNEQVCNLGKLVNSTVIIKNHGMDIPEFTIQNKEVISVKIDPDLFRQALLIIIKKVGSLHECSKTMVLSIKKLAKKAIIFFEPSCQKNWFAEEAYKSFYSGGDHQSRKELSVALEILKYYGGNIGLEVQNNDDMKFYLELPICEEG